jgi:hypothetical protein
MKRGSLTAENEDYMESGSEGFIDWGVTGEMSFERSKVEGELLREDGLAKWMPQRMEERTASERPTASVSEM